MSKDQQVRDLISSYSVFVDDRRMEDVTQLFFPDGVVSVRGKVVTNGLIQMNGHQEIMAWLLRLTAGGGPVGKHYLSNMLVTWTSETTAHVETDMMFVKQAAPPQRWEVFELARYVDEVALDGDRWRMKSRDINIFP